MRLHTLIAIAVTMCALPAVAAELPVAPAPRAANQSAVIKLRNVAAADAAQAVGTFIKARKLNAVVVAEPVSNTVLLSAEPALQQQLLDVLTALDKQPTQVILQVLVMKVSKDFVEQSGLNIGAAPGASSWTLSPRELQMLTGLIRAAKTRGECDVLSRPTLCVNDNQTGSVQVGQELPVEQLGAKAALVATGFTYRATPRVKPDGGIVLRAEVQITEKGQIVASNAIKPGSKLPATQLVQAVNTQTVQGTNELKPGETLVTRFGNTLVIITPTVTK